MTLKVMELVPAGSKRLKGVIGESLGSAGSVRGSGAIGGASGFGALHAVIPSINPAASNPIVLIRIKRGKRCDWVKTR
ncbi:hypothetical protein MHY01S_11800 [Meiothermus hypogaeus NBRC 106114]|uniref:Uncharacterized protein n=1 Tax=Meiothermus hypogaeus NBRC 106114 TaxID=1227553 RepID=A0A511R078_9DEIN|nr:hypothetical protein MHY01S_11800 [Meiothermus hypogaeus NBRC 106114]